MAQYKKYRVDLEIVRNDTINLDIAFTDYNGVNIPAATFASAKCMARKSRGQNPILTFDTADTTIVLTDGNINLNSSETLTDIKEQKYVYDIEFVLASDGQVITPIGGTFNIVNDQTFVTS